MPMAAPRCAEAPVDRHAAIALLFRATQAMHDAGTPLMRRVLAGDGDALVGARYPAEDVVNGAVGSRYFYHCHHPGERGPGEHGHFHLFVDRSAMPPGAQAMFVPPSGHDGPTVVHVAALSISGEGLPIGWFAVNRWVTEDWLYPAEAIIPTLDRFDLRGTAGDALVNDWLTAMVELCRGDIAALLRDRDAAIAARHIDGEDRSAEVLSHRPIDLAALLDA